MDEQNSEKMRENKLHQLQLKEAVSVLSADIASDLQLKKNIELMRKYVSLFDVKKGYFMCKGPYGKAVAERKNVTLHNLLTYEPMKVKYCRRHIDAVHTALYWAIFGTVEHE